MDGTLIIFFAIILIVGVSLFALITAVSKKGKTQLDVIKYRSRWLKIEQQLVRDNPTSYQIAILEADKLLDAALKERRLPGDTMGERMKSAQKMWANANNVWTAHKIRNQIAHETDIKLSYDASRRALSAYKQGLKDLGAV